MRVSTKGRYGVRIMVGLALVSDDTVLPVKVIAQNQEISEKYIEQIINLLGKAGLVQAKRGAQGGYRLGYASQEITIGQILRVTEGILAPVECTISREYCSRCGNCAAFYVWDKMRVAIEDVVDNMTLHDLATHQRELDIALAF